MFDLAYDAKHSVLLSRFFGTYSPADIELRDNAVRRFVAKSGLVRGLMDYSAVDAIDVPLDLLIQRAHQPGILTGHQRVIVAPSEPAYSFNRLVAAAPNVAIVVRVAHSVGCPCLLAVLQRTRVLSAADGSSNSRRLVTPSPLTHRATSWVNLKWCLESHWIFGA